MNKKFKFVSITFLIILIILLVNMSFAWYTAKVNQGIVDLTSESIEITINSQKDKLSPGILKEGIITIGSDGSYIVPKDITNSEYYVSVGEKISITQDIKITYDKNNLPNALKLNFSVSYIDNTGKLVTLNEELNDYFDVTYSITLDDGSIIDCNDLNLSSEHDTAYYKLNIEISYKLPDELLPLGLITSNNLVFIVKGSLT